MIRPESLPCRVGRTVLLFAALCLGAIQVAAGATPYLRMPWQAGPLPTRLSETGVFADVRGMTPAPGLMRYDINLSFWSDGAQKERWVAVPDGATIHNTVDDAWQFPAGTVFVKTFEIALDRRHPERRRRLETRLLVRDSSGGVYGAVYKWRADNSDADLLADARTEALVVRDARGAHTQNWYYPSRNDCLTCHTANAGGVLGVNTRQLNRALTADGQTDNQLLAWSRLGLLETPVTETSQASLPALARSDDTDRSLADRARSYLDVNCAQCHRPGGTVAAFDARYATPLEQQQLIGGPVLIDEGIDHARVIAPNDPWRSILYVRANGNEDFRMPPLARNTIDVQGMTLLRQWIESLPGPSVAAPPEITPRGGNYRAAVTVRLSSPAGARIRYTLDGTVPTTADPVYEQPIRINRPTILRTRAFVAGQTDSVVSQQVYVVTH
jgi:uncharacterized repeat protein (TIGR03806 family)